MAVGLIVQICIQTAFQVAALKLAQREDWYQQPFSGDDDATDDDDFAYLEGDGNTVQSCFCVDGLVSSFACSIDFWGGVGGVPRDHLAVHRAVHRLQSHGALPRPSVLKLSISAQRYHPGHLSCLPQREAINEHYGKPTSSWTVIFIFGSDRADLDHAIT